MSKYIDINIDELDIAKLYFERNDKDIISSINYCIRNNSINDILSLVTKYLLNNNIDSKSVRRLIYKYALFIIYFDLYKDGFIDNDMNEKTLNSWCYEGLYLSDFVDYEFKSEFFKNIYNDEKDYKYFENKLELLKDKGYKKLACLSSIYRMNFAYQRFDFDITYTYKKNISNYDLIVADSINSSLLKLEFKLSDMFNSNTKCTGAELRSLQYFIALLLKNNIDNNNYIIDDIKLKSSYIKVISRAKEFSPNKVNFICKKEEYEDYYIDYNKINSFKFIYNNIEYEFNKNGIIKL